MQPSQSLQSSQPQTQQDSETEGDDGVLEISDGEMKRKVLMSNRVCVFDVYASWCGPCKAIKGSYAQMAARYNKPGACMLVRENESLKLSRDVRGFPTFKFFKEGEYLADKDVVGADLRSVESTLRSLL